MTTAPTDCTNGGATYLFWVKLLDPTNGGILSSLSWNPPREGINIKQNSNNLAVGVYRKGATDNRFIETISGVVYNTWIQITVVWHNDPKLQAYFNDDFAGEVSGPYTSASTVQDNEGKLVLGRRYTNMENTYCSMIIDNINLYNRPLTADEISLVYNTYA